MTDGNSSKEVKEHGDSDCSQIYLARNWNIYQIQMENIFCRFHSSGSAQAAQLYPRESCSEIPGHLLYFPGHELLPLLY